MRQNSQIPVTFYCLSQKPDFFDGDFWRKIRKFLPLAVVFLALLILMALNTNSADVDYYRFVFTRLENGDNYRSVEYGYWLLCKICVTLGISFYPFKLLSSFIALIFISSFVGDYTDKPEMVLLCYFFYPFLLDVAQFRHFLALSLVLFSTKFLRKGNATGYFIFAFSIFIAAFVHEIALAYFVLIGGAFLDNKKTILASAAIALFFIAFHKVIPSLWLYEVIIGARKSQDDYAAGMRLSQFVMYFGFYSFLALLMVFLRYGLKLSYTKKEDFLLRISLISYSLSPAMLIDYQFSRIFRGMIIALYCFIILSLQKIESKKIRVLGIAGIFGVLFAVFVKLFGRSSGYWDTLTKPIFRDNMLLSRIFSFLDSV